MTEQYIPTRQTFAKPSEAFRAQARLFRNLGDDETASRWDRQAEAEEAWEASSE